MKCGSLENPPCYCEHLGGIRYNLKCFNVESKTIGDYLKAPDLSNDDLEVEFEEFAIVPFKLMASVSLEEIGENVLGNRRARVIRIATPEPYNYNVTINQDAFASSANFTQELIIYDADLSALNWDFAKNFTNLTAIHLQGIVGGIEKFSSDVPVLPSVTWLRMVRCTTTSTKYLPLASQLPSINNISLIENGITDGQIAEILNPMNGAQLEYVSLRKNELSLYPTKFTSFPTLRSVDLSENKIAVLDGNNPLQFTAPVRQVDLSNNLIRSLLNENGLFKGMFAAYNNLDIA